MKNIKRNLLNSVLLIALFAPAAFADGDMGGGGKTPDPGDENPFMNALFEYLDLMF